MANFWETKEFKRQNKEWAERLLESGFQDHENEKGHLKQHDLRTISSQNRRSIRQFYDLLRDYLIVHPEIPQKYQVVLELYLQGTRIQGHLGIIEQTGYCDKSVRNIIQKYRRLALGES